MTNFLTIFPELEDMHLCKDVGMIPYLLHREHGYNSNILTYDNGPYPRIENELKGLKLEIMPKTYNRLFDICKYLLYNAKNIDVLQMYHMSNDSIMACWFYKSLNPKGITYLKADGGQILYNNLISSFAKFDLITVESQYGYDSLKSKYPEALIIPNGVDFAHLPESIPYSQKNNWIVHSGRLGDPLKNTEMVINTFIAVCNDYPDWKLLLIGPMDTGFKLNCKELIRQRGLEDKIIMTGYISDMEELYDYYNKSKIVFMPSRSESWCLALLECMALGCVPLVSSIPIFKELTKGFAGSWCYSEDAKEFEISLRIMVDKKNQGKMELRSTRCKEETKKYNWSKICDRIDKELQERLC